MSCPLNNCNTNLFKALLIQFCIMFPIYSLMNGLSEGLWVNFIATVKFFVIFNILVFIGKLFFPELAKIQDGSSYFRWLKSK